MLLDTYDQCFKIDSTNSLPCLDPILGVGFINFEPDLANYETSLSYIGMLFSKVKSQNKVNEVKESTNLGNTVYTAKTIELGEVTLPSPSSKSWKHLHDEKYTTWISPMHVLVLTGYDQEYYYFNDPWQEKNTKYPKEQVKKAYRALGRQAVTIVPKS